MDAQHLNIDTIKENRNFKGITQEDTKELIDTLYAFSILSYEAYTKKRYTIWRIFDLKRFLPKAKSNKKSK